MTNPHTHLAGCGCVDVHTHVVPLEFPKYAGRHAGARWPSMTDAKPCHRHVLLDGKVYRTVSHQNWDTGVRTQDMAASGVERQVLSAMPELLSYWLEPDDGVAMCRFLNETIAGMVATDPGRFTGLGAVPLQDVDLAIRELEHAVRVLGLAGVEIGTNVDGVPIGAERFQPFFRACVELGAAVFVHALRPAGMDRLVGPPVFEQTIAFPGEVGLAAASMITGGSLFANPGLRIAFSHGGGSLQILIARMQHAWEAIPGVRDALREAPRDSARRMYFDDLLYDKVAIEALVHLVGPSQVMVGTDYPFAILDKDPLGRVASLALPGEVQRALVRDNALRWLGLAA
mgnify:CR=1 FL=1